LFPYLLPRLPQNRLTCICVPMRIGSTDRLWYPPQTSARPLILPDRPWTASCSTNNIGRVRRIAQPPPLWRPLEPFMPSTPSRQLLVSTQVLRTCASLLTALSRLWMKHEQADESSFALSRACQEPARLWSG